MITRYFSSFRVGVCRGVNGGGPGRGRGEGVWGKRRDFYDPNGTKPAGGAGGEWGLFLRVASTLGSVSVGRHE